MGDGEAATGAAQGAQTFDPLRLDIQLCFALYTASNLMTRAYRPLLEPLGLTYLQYLALMALWAQAPQSVGDLGRRLGLDASTLTPLCKRMETAGLVTRTRDPEDQRRVLIGLTPRAQALREKAAAVPGAMFCQLPMPFEESAALKASVERLIAGLRQAEAE
ncbi:MAG: MarR family transcriptional regulator [Alphaproteobacteria bacterium]|nr:MarR family transcriptional regulator [Alphaproteobacteria bacterium]MBU1514695.1 MarR family transcriptional regulator [Alphaproteobacteria bacterium]MBU2093554.1 MarR family transcriptional regulator [Alphaproteobacteria bacterium]MBU2149468.1 MarR family transcriptional regulator [Alphaproteobacteria bacterium]MBU2305489.1 MarR family transcriptional regulator [Alphaproteobacteria bacterium]